MVGRSNKSYSFVKSKRPVINPNEGFVKQLKKYSSMLTKLRKEKEAAQEEIKDTQDFYDNELFGLSNSNKTNLEEEKFFKNIEDQKAVNNVTK